jgi:hypothetical protein
VKEWDALPLWEKVQWCAWTVDAVHDEALPPDRLRGVFRDLEEVREEVFKLCRRFGVSG